MAYTSSEHSSYILRRTVPQAKIEAGILLIFQFWGYPESAQSVGQSDSKAILDQGGGKWTLFLYGKITL